MVVIGALFAALIIYDYPRSGSQLPEEPKLEATEQSQTLPKVAIALWLLSAGIMQPIPEAKNFHETLKNLQRAREGRLHWKSLESVFNDDNEEGMLKEAKQFLRQSWDHPDVSNEEQEERMQIIDYIGEKLVGRVPTSSREELKTLASAVLNVDVLDGEYEEKKKQSLLGDKIEILQYVAIADMELAKSIAAQHPYPKELPLLEGALENAHFLSN